MAGIDGTLASVICKYRFTLRMRQFSKYWSYSCIVICLGLWSKPIIYALGLFHWFKTKVSYQQANLKCSHIYKVRVRVKYLLKKSVMPVK